MYFDKLVYGLIRKLFFFFFFFFSLWEIKMLCGTLPDLIGSVSLKLCYVQLISDNLGKFTNVNH